MVKEKSITYLRLENLSAYTISSELSDIVWDIVMKWEWVPKKTLGTQWINATDSMAGNIAEGFGRYHKKDKQKFYYNARGSVYESAHWTKKAFMRKLITQEQHDYIMKKLRLLPREINQLIKYTENKLTI